MKEKFEQSETMFDIEKSPIKEAYILLGAKTPAELSKLYTEADQVLFKSREWDYDNPDLVVNKVKSILENVDANLLTEEEKEWRDDILWFWYHHAVSVTSWRNDRAKAQEFAARAISFKFAEEYNKITKLLYFLANNQVADAEEWVKEIVDKVEKKSALEIIEEYKRGEWWHE